MNGTEILEIVRRRRATLGSNWFSTRNSSIIIHPGPNISKKACVSLDLHGKNRGLRLLRLFMSLVLTVLIYYSSFEFVEIAA